jgi:hypothetical protein
MSEIYLTTKLLSPIEYDIVEYNLWISTGHIVNTDVEARIDQYSIFYTFTQVLYCYRLSNTKEESETKVLTFI